MWFTFVCICDCVCAKIENSNPHWQDEIYNISYYFYIIIWFWLEKFYTANFEALHSWLHASNRSNGAHIHTHARITEILKYKTEWSTTRWTTKLKLLIHWLLQHHHFLARVMSERARSEWEEVGTRHTHKTQFENF